MDATLKKLREFFQKGRTMKYKKRYTFLHAGDTPQGVHFIKKGYVRLYSIAPDGKELTLVIYRPGDFFPVVWGLQGTYPSAYYFEAITSVELERVEWKQFNEFVNENLDVFRLLVGHILVRFQTALRRMEYLAFGNSYTKVVSMFVIVGEGLGHKSKTGTTIAIPLAHRDLASLVGLTRETVTIEVGKLKKAGLISQKGSSFTILDVRRLKREAVESLR